MSVHSQHRPSALHQGAQVPPHTQLPLPGHVSKVAYHRDHSKCGKKKKHLLQSADIFVFIPIFELHISLSIALVIGDKQMFYSSISMSFKHFLLHNKYY